VVTRSCDDCVVATAVVDNLVVVTVDNLVVVTVDNLVVAAVDNLVVAAVDSRCFLFAGGFSLHVLL